MGHKTCSGCWFLWEGLHPEILGLGGSQIPLELRIVLKAGLGVGGRCLSWGRPCSLGGLGQAVGCLLPPFPHVGGGGVSLPPSRPLARGREGAEPGSVKSLQAGDGSVFSHHEEFCKGLEVCPSSIWLGKEERVPQGWLVPTSPSPGPGGTWDGSHIWGGGCRASAAPPGCPLPALRGLDGTQPNAQGWLQACLWVWEVARPTSPVGTLLPSWVVRWGRHRGGGGRQARVG